MPTALITGASRGLGLALARALAHEGWDLVIDARGEDDLVAAARELRGLGAKVRAVAGDVANEPHRRTLVDAAARAGDLSAVVLNASVLGPSPLPPLAEYPIAALERVYAVNVLAPLRIVQLVLPRLRPGARIVAITSDAAVEAYPGWGGYGSSKAALEQVANVLAAERPDLRVHAVDPGDMRTRMHAEAFPGEDISDRPDPAERVGGLLRLLTEDLPSGRHRVSDLLVAA